MKGIAETNYFFIEKDTKPTRAEQRVFATLGIAAFALLVILAVIATLTPHFNPIQSATPDLEGDTTTSSSASFDDFTVKIRSERLSAIDIEKSLEVTQRNTSDASNIPHNINPKFNLILRAKDILGCKNNSMSPSPQLNLIEDNDEGKKQRNVTIVSILSLSSSSTLEPTLIEENTTDINNNNNNNKTEVEVMKTTTATTTNLSENGIEVTKMIPVFRVDNFLGPEDIAGTKNNALDEDPSSGFTITVFAYNNFGEPSFTVQNISKCLTLPGDWHRRINSVNTDGNCVEICPYAACSGQCMILSPGSLGHNRLRDINFDKRITSVRPCPSWT